MNANMSAGAIKVREFVYGNGLDDLVYMEQDKPLNYNDEQEEEGYTEVYAGGGFSSAVKRYFFQKDLAGSTKIVSDIQGKVIEMYAYDSFGRIYERNGISSNYRPFQTSRINHNRFFTGREYDTDLQQYYYRARWYSPALGRFTSRDPLGYSEGPNLYAYVGNNPTTFTDPWGLKASELIDTNIDPTDYQNNGANPQFETVCSRTEGSYNLHLAGLCQSSLQKAPELISAGATIGAGMGLTSCVMTTAGYPVCSLAAITLGTAGGVVAGGVTSVGGCALEGLSYAANGLVNYATSTEVCQTVPVRNNNASNKNYSESRGNGNNSSGPKSLNQMNDMIKKGQAPKTLERFDTGKILGEKNHVHFTDGSALNIDGTWKHGSKILTNIEKDFLRQSGWILP